MQKLSGLAVLKLGVALTLMGVVPITASAQELSSSFRDVDGHWAEDAIAVMEQSRVITGYPGNLFYPDRGITREEFAKILVMGLGLPVVSATSHSYTDVSSTSWAAPYIIAVQEIFPGSVKNGKSVFNGQQYATREDIVAAIVRGIEYQSYQANTSILAERYTDWQNIMEDKRSLIAIATEVGLVEGNNGYFRPQSTVTRAEAAVILARAQKIARVTLGEGPDLNVVVPEVSGTQVLTVYGDTAPGVRLFVGGQEVPVDGAGIFRHTVTLAEGDNQLQFKVKDSLGRITTLVRSVAYYVNPPKLSVDLPVRSDTGEVVVRGITDVGAKVLVNGQQVPVNAWNGNFVFKLRLRAGLNIVRTVSKGVNGSQAVTEKSILFEEDKPKLIISVPQLSQEPLVPISGLVALGSTVTVNKEFVPVNSVTGSFATWITLKDVRNEVEIVVYDSNGRRRMIRKVIQYDVEHGTKPTLSVEVPTDANTEVVTVVGTTEITNNVTVNGVPVEVDIATGQFTADVVLQPGDNLISINAVNGFGLSSVIQKHIVFNQDLASTHVDVTNTAE